MKKRPVKTLTLPARQAVCLRAIRTGKTRRTDIAVAARLSLKNTKAALEALCEQGLIGRDPRRRDWVLTERGQTCALEKGHKLKGEDQRPRSRMEVGPAGERLLDLLAHPMRGHEIARQLNVSRERVRQLIVRLMALGRVRVGDPDRVTLIVARHEDPSVLLSYSGERVLSSLPQTEETTASSVAGAVEVPRADVMKLLTLLGDKGLVRETTSSHFGFLGCGGVGWLGWGRLRRCSAGRARWRPSKGQGFQELGPGGEHNIGAQGLQVVEEAGSGPKRLAGVPPSA